jgi:zinc protease
MLRPLLALVFIVATAIPAGAGVVGLTSPRGIAFWLFEDHARPMTTIGFRFAGGAAEDPPGKEGLGNMIAEMFFQGAGRQQADDYLLAWSRLGAEAKMEIRAESIRGTLKVLNSDRGKAVDLLAEAISAPRTDASSLALIGDQVLAGIDHDASDPGELAYATYRRQAYGGHALARPMAGTSASVLSISAADIKQARRQTMTRDRLSIAVVGDIDPSLAGAIVDQLFAPLPEHGDRRLPQQPTPLPGSRADILTDAAQTEVAFGMPLGRLDDREQLAAEIFNYALGGSAFTSRLYREVRDRRGLAYSIETSVDNYSFGSELSGSFGSDPATIEQALDIVHRELARLAEEGPTDAEIEEAKAALSGQYLRGLVKHIDLANELTLRMQEGYPPDTIATYASRLRAVSRQDVLDFAHRFVAAGRLAVAVAGPGGKPAAATGAGRQTHEHR